MDQDKWVIRAVVCFIGMTTLVIVAGTLMLAYQEKPIDDYFKITSAAALGALSALLAKTGYDRYTQRVEVANDPTNPVPVTDEPH